MYIPFCCSGCTDRIRRICERTEERNMFSFISEPSKFVVFRIQLLLFQGICDQPKSSLLLLFFPAYGDDHIVECLTKISLRETCVMFIERCQSIGSMTKKRPASPPRQATPQTRVRFGPTTRSTDGVLCLKYTNANDMDQLPLELYEHIFSYLLSQKHREQLVALPVSTKSERTDIYNLRLTSRRICMGASQLLLNILQDVATQCKENSFRHLAALVDIPTIASNMTCLTLRTEESSRECVSDSLVDDFSVIDRRIAWMQEDLHSSLVSIIQKAPRIRHLIYVLDENRWQIALLKRMGYKYWEGQETTPEPIPFHVSSRRVQFQKNCFLTSTSDSAKRPYDD
jgi:hypothetical protein